MISLPAILVDRDVTRALELLRDVGRARLKLIEVDASAILSVEPVALCVLALASKIATAQKKEIVIRDAPQGLREPLETMGAQLSWERSAAVPERQLNSQTTAAALQTVRGANTECNALADRIAAFIPAEDRENLLEDQYGLKIHHAVQPALAYLLTELVDNVFSHSATVDNPTPTAWLCVQWYHAQDLVRIAVVDDGCGLLASLRALDPPPKNHFQAAALAFQPFVTSKGVPLLYQERTHMGLGMTVCRDICAKLGGTIYAGTGNALVRNAGLSTEDTSQLDPLVQGTIVSLEFHRRAATVRTLPDILAKYQGTPDLRLRFD